MSSADRPWYFDLVKEVGGLGLVLIMLVGLYLLGDKYLSSMSDTWNSIEQATEAQLKEAQEHRAQVQGATSDFIAATTERMNNHSAELVTIRERLSALEREQ